MARTSLGQLTIDMVMRTAGFEEGMTRAERIAQQRSRAIQRQINVVSASITAMAGAAQAFATRIFNTSVIAIDSTAKMAAQIGTTTETLTAMRYAVQQVAAISDEGFDQAMRRMTRRVADAARGTGAAATSIRALGLDAKELAEMPLDQQFLRISDAMSKVNDKGKELIYTMAIFDTGGMPIVNALRQGSEATQELMDKAERLGYVLSSADALLIEDLNTARDNLSRSLDAVTQKAVIGVAPALKEMSESAIQYLEGIENLGDKAAAIFSAMNSLIQTAAILLASRLAGAALSSAAAFSAKAAATAISNYQMLTGTGIAGRYAAGLVVLRGAAVAARVALSLLGGVFGVVALAATAGYMAWNKNSKATDDYKRSLELLKQPMDEVSAKIKTMTKDQQQALMATSLATVDTNKQAVEKALKDLERSIAVGLSDGFSGTKKELGDLLDELKETIRVGGSVYEVLDKAAGAGMIDRTIVNSVTSYAAALQVAKDELTESVIKVGDLSTALREAESSAHGAASGVSALTEEMLRAREEGKKYAAQLSERLITAGLRTETERFDALVKSGRLAFETEEALLKARKDAIEYDRRTASTSKSVSTARNAEATATQNLIDKLLPLQKINSDYEKDLSRLNATQRSGKINAEQYTEAYERLNRLREDAVKALIPEEVKRMKELERTAQSSMATYITQQERMLATLSASSQVKELVNELGAIEDKYRGIAEQMAASPRGISGLDLEQLKEYMEAEMAVAEHYHNRRMEREESWLEGAKRGLQEYVDSVGTAANITQGLMGSALGRIEDALVDTLLTGELKFGDLARAIGQDMVRALVQMGVQMAANFAMSKLFTSASAATAALTGASIATAYAPAAALASLASFGANAAPASAGILSTVAVAEMAAFAGMFDEGGRIPSGKWGIAGEFGPEIIQGPANVTSREDTMRLLNSRSGDGGDVIVQFYGNPSLVEGVESDRDDFGQRVIRVMLADQQSGGEYARSTERTYALRRQGR